jgi:membrane protein YqaA with SNARE-associated domain
MTVSAILISLFIGSLVSAFVPLVNSELLLLTSVALAPPALLLPMVASVTAGQMAGKVALYLAGQGVLALPFARQSARVQRVLAGLDQYRTTSGTLVFASASMGLPPFYAVAIASGVARIGMARFLVLGGTGRFLRFAAIAMLPRVAKFFIA